MDQPELLKQTSAKLHKAFVKNEAYDNMENDIDFVFSCALHKKKSIWEWSVDELYRLAAISANVQNRMLHIMKNGNAHEKFIITCSVQLNAEGTAISREFIGEILKLAITDKNKKVKIFGVQRADSMNFYDLIPIIKTELDKTTDKKLKEKLNLNYIFLTKGYFIETTETRKIVHFNSGFRTIPDHVEENKLHEWIVEKYKDNNRLRYLYLC